MPTIEKLVNRETRKRKCKRCKQAKILGYRGRGRSHYCEVCREIMECKVNKGRPRNESQVS